MASGTAAEDRCSGSATSGMGQRWAHPGLGPVLIRGVRVVPGAQRPPVPGRSVEPAVVHDRARIAAWSAASGHRGEERRPGAAR